MTFDMSYGERYRYATIQKTKAVQAGRCGNPEGSWKQHQAYMNIHGLIKLDQEYKDSQPMSLIKTEKKTEEDIGYQEARLCNEIKNVLDVQEQSVLGVNAYSMASLEQANKTQGVMQAFWAESDNIAARCCLGSPTP